MVATIATVLALLTAPQTTPDFQTHDRAAPKLTVVSSVIDRGVRVAEVTYTFRGKPIRALFVEPIHARRHAPGVLFAHWLGDPATTNRTEFRADAMWLAQRGVVSLLPDEPWSQPNWFEAVRTRASDAAESAAAVAGLRRALDVLIETGSVDSKKVAFVGHDFGAMYGALFVSTDRRVRVAAFMTPTTTFREWFDLDTKRPPTDPAAYERELSQFDVPPYLAHARLRASLAQFAQRDPYVSATKAREFATALPARDRTVRTYTTGHALGIERATNDRRSWLIQHLR